MKSAAAPRTAAALCTTMAKTPVGVAATRFKNGWAEHQPPRQSQRHLVTAAPSFTSASKGVSALVLEDGDHVAGRVVLVRSHGEAAADLALAGHRLRVLHPDGLLLGLRSVASHTELSVTPLGAGGRHGHVLPGVRLRGRGRLLFGRGTRRRQNGKRHHGPHTQQRAHWLSLRVEGPRRGSGGGDHPNQSPLDDGKDHSIPDQATVQGADSISTDKSHSVLTPRPAQFQERAPAAARFSHSNGL